MIAFLTLLLFAGPALPNVPVPPDAVYDAGLTKAATARAQVEVKDVLGRLDRDTVMSAAEKAEVRRKIERLKLLVYTTPRSLEETVAFYEKSIPGSNFLKGERYVLQDALDVAKAGNFALPAGTEQKWGTTMGHSARWRSGDGAVEIDVEDHLVDPRDGSIRKKTVLLLTSTQ